MAALLLAVIYLSFISLGLPDSLLGAAWPTMSTTLNAPLSWAGGISMTISAGTIISALVSDRMTLRFGAGKVTACSVGVTALALIGFSFAPNYWVLILLAIPYGLGAGCVDAAINNYVAVHYSSRHMSWLHGMWGLGALIGPYIMSYAIGRQQGWQWGYRYIGFLQIALTVIIALSIPLWISRKAAASKAEEDAPVSVDDGGVIESVEEKRKPLGLLGVLRLAGAKQILVMFLCYCAVEQTCILWASSYMVHANHIDAVQATQFAALFFIGITAGRFLSGVLTMKFSDPMMIRLGQLLLGIGIVLLFIPTSSVWPTLVAFVILGFGCAPIYPCVIHSTPGYFGADKSQAIVGVQMAFAYIGAMLMPALFGLLAQYWSIRLLPWYVLFFTTLMVVMHESLRKRLGDRVPA